ncbi:MULTISPECIES: DUF6265 family protein [unclassified Lysobacter]|uniref:DUF6265 family protein n=1 Tax=unclassified Lysobacter TaxID=2635362 RepID=UPI0006F26906|nr:MULTISPECIES: DUF6265 family protein [unclassified Lysobacter]KQZ56421.1 hypothetical protein ASD53_12805 [Lysobacter sp. Root559]KRC35143.1 hypothetical protein ASE10_10775 [Lysobacter sp. Root76]KRD70831.1 hypothetical protein ASE45_02940 [Lysobacter sp. Root96]
MKIAIHLMAPALLLAGSPAPASEAADPGLGWMAGHWCSEAGGERIDETWLPAAQGRLYGVSRTVRAGEVTSFEFLRIEPVDGVATYLAQPGGGPATAFARSDGGANRVRFENPAHDFPQSIEYRRDGERLHAEIAGPGRDGKPQRIPFEYRRCGE